MDLNELNSIDINNPEQVKRVQEHLKKQGYYAKKIDGIWGEGMAAARKQFSKDQAEKEAREAKEADAKAKREEEAKDRQAIRDREAAEAKSKRDKEEADAKAIRDAKAAEDQRVKDVETGKILAGSTVAGLGLGLAGGKLADHMGNAAIVNEMQARDAQLKPLAASSRAINPAAPNALLMHRDIASVADAQGLTRKPIPWGTGLTGAALGGFGAYSTFGRAPEAKSDIEAAIWKGSGYGEMSAAAKMMADSVRRYKNPGYAYSSDDLNAIEGSRRIAKSGKPTAIAPPGDTPPYTPPAAPPPPPAGGGQQPQQPQGPIRHSQRFREAVEITGSKPGKSKASNYEALRKGITDQNLPDVAERLNLPRSADKSTVLQRAREMLKTPGKASIIWPFVAAGSAYLGSSSPSEAGNGEPRAPNADPATTAGIAGATAYGLNRLLNAVPTAGGPLAANAVMTFDPLEGGSEEDTRHNIMTARGDLNALLPSVGRAIGVTPQEQQSYEMAQVPTPSPARVQRQADTRQDAEYMRRYLADEPVNMPASAPGWEERAAADPFDAELAELAELLGQLEGQAEPQRRSAPVVMPSPTMVSPALQNRLLSAM